MKKKKEKINTTNYYNTFIEVAEDTKVSCGTKLPFKTDKNYCRNAI